MTWETLNSPYDGSFYGILALGEADLIAYGLRGKIFHSLDAGETWTPVATDARGLIATAAVTKSGIVFAGQSRTWLVSRDHGQTVAPLVPAPLTTGVAELLVLPDGTLLALGEAGATLLPAMAP
jgi:photosystem II stability/assembly factor-like uncharacterized protein